MRFTVGVGVDDFAALHHGHRCRRYSVLLQDAIGNCIHARFQRWIDRVHCLRCDTHGRAADPHQNKKPKYPIEHAPHYIPATGR